MAIDNPNVIDGVAVDKDNDSLIMLLTDHFEWTQTGGEDILSEYDHLMMIQEKLNLYVSYFTSRQYEDTFPDCKVKSAVIDVRFKYDISENCEMFLQVVQNKLAEIDMQIKYTVG